LSVSIGKYFSNIFLMMAILFLVPFFGWMK
jgi:hypothetical protein